MLNTITVSQLNTYVKSVIENDPRIAIVNVSGEISNFKNHFSSGHWYFTLKDSNASIRCVMFRSCASRVRFNVEDGMAVVLRGKVSLYEKDGQYQFYAEEMHPIGDGDLALQFKQIKEKLEQEGLFDVSNKRPLIKLPKRIAVITSDTGAAVKDILNITQKRYPACEIVMCPVLVQGDSAAQDMINTLDKVYTLNDIDTIIIGRGGGSAEDLHCFNDEKLARKIYESPFPVISAVGHETDFTICDFVADVRASTPSHAAELAVPDYRELNLKIDTLSKRLISAIMIKYNKFVSLNESLKLFFSKSNVDRFLEKKQLQLDFLSENIVTRTKNIFQFNSIKTKSLITRIDSLSPLKIMTRGFSVVAKDGTSITSCNDLNVGDSINVMFCDGDVNCLVTNINDK